MGIQLKVDRVETFKEGTVVAGNYYDSGASGSRVYYFDKNNNGTLDTGDKMELSDFNCNINRYRMWRKCLGDPRHVVKKGWWEAELCYKGKARYAYKYVGRVTKSAVARDGTVVSKYFKMGKKHRRVIRTKIKPEVKKGCVNYNSHQIKISCLDDSLEYRADSRFKPPLTLWTTIKTLKRNVLNNGFDLFDLKVATRYEISGFYITNLLGRKRCLFLQSSMVWAYYERLPYRERFGLKNSRNFTDVSYNNNYNAAECTNAGCYSEICPSPDNIGFFHYDIARDGIIKKKTVTKKTVTKKIVTTKKVGRSSLGIEVGIGGTFGAQTGSGHAFSGEVLGRYVFLRKRSFNPFLQLEVSAGRLMENKPSNFVGIRAGGGIRVRWDKFKWAYTSLAFFGGPLFTSQGLKLQVGGETAFGMKIPLSRSVNLMLDFLSVGYHATMRHKDRTRHNISAQTRLSVQF